MATNGRHFIKNERLLKKLLWADVAAGGSTGIIGLAFLRPVAELFGLNANLLLVVFIVTLVYALLALYLATRRQPPAALAQRLAGANWVWTAVSVLMLLYYYKEATTLGNAFLVLQVLVVGALAYSEGKQIGSKSN